MKRAKCFCIALFLFLSFSCLSIGHSQPKLDWDQLFPKVHDLPNGWSRSRIFEACISAPLDSGCDNYQAKWVSYWSLDDHHFMIEIRYYEDLVSAGNDYPGYFKMHFAERPNTSNFIQPSEIEFQSHIAEEYHYGCSQVIDEYNRIESNCVITAQYGSYLIASSEWFDETPDYAAIQAIMQAIDEKMIIFMANPPILSREK